MFVTTLEAIQSSDKKRAVYIRWILAFLAILVVAKTFWFSRWGAWHDRNLVDFDAFRIIAQRVWIGDLDQAYQFAKLIVMQREASGGLDSFMPWTYPPQFSLLLAPFALIPTGAGYLLFTASTLAFYLVVLRKLAGEQLVLLLIILFPTIMVTMACGQNGFLTAALIGLVCLYFEDRPVLAGLALGAMIIKPHLAIAFALYTILRRRWSVAVTAGAVVLGSSAICTLIFGTQIWSGLLLSVHDSSIFLEQGYYPLYRMISFYAALRTAGFSASFAFVGQAAVACFALGIVIIAFIRMPARWSLGLTAMASICISPYAYDYDFPIVGIGLALLLPSLQAAASPVERGAIYAAAMLIGAYGNLRSSQLGTGHTAFLDVLSIGGFLSVSMLALALVVLLRALKASSVGHFAASPIARA